MLLVHSSGQYLGEYGTGTVTWHQRRCLACGAVTEAVAGVTWWHTGTTGGCRC